MSWVREHSRADVGLRGREHVSITKGLGQPSSEVGVQGTPLYWLLGLWETGFLGFQAASAP